MRNSITISKFFPIQPAYLDLLLPFEKKEVKLVGIYKKELSGRIWELQVHLEIGAGFYRLCAETWNDLLISKWYNEMGDLNPETMKEVLAEVILDNQPSLKEIRELRKT